jgi:hypothetical protein
MPLLGSAVTTLTFNDPLMSRTTDAIKRTLQNDPLLVSPATMEDPDDFINPVSNKNATMQSQAVLRSANSPATDGVRTSDMTGGLRG